MEQEIGFWSEKPQQNQITSKKFTRGQNLKISSRTGSIWKLFGNRFKVCFFHTIFIILKIHLHGKYTIILRCLKSATQPQIPYTLVCGKRIRPSNQNTCECMRISHSCIRFLHIVCIHHGICCCAAFQASQDGIRSQLHSLNFSLFNIRFIHQSSNNIAINLYNTQEHTAVNVILLSKRCLGARICYKLRC